MAQEKKEKTGEMDAMLMQTISTRISEDEKRELNLFANLLGVIENRRVSASEITRIAIVEYIEKHRPELNQKDLLKGIRP